MWADYQSAAKLLTLENQGFYSGFLPLDKLPVMANESCPHAT
jgi:hypothetical protein